MNCPYCDSRVREVPDNRCCPNCGGPLGACVPDEVPEERVFPEPPLGTYSGDDCWLEIGKNSVRIKKKVTFSQISDYELSYEELTGVVFQPAANGYFGYLSLRCGLNQQTPFPSSLVDVRLDATSVSFNKGGNAGFERVYAFLKQRVDVANSEPKAEKPSFVLKFPVPPVGVYKGYCGSVEIKNDGVCFVREFPLNPKSWYTVLYEELVAVDYVEPGIWQAGILRVRCKENRNMGFTKDAADQETSIQFIQDWQGRFRQVSEFLQECARIANEARKQ